MVAIADPPVPLTPWTARLGTQRLTLLPFDDPAADFLDRAGQAFVGRPLERGTMRGLYGLHLTTKWGYDRP